MDHDGFLGIGGDLHLFDEDGALGFAGGEVVVIVESYFADGYYLWMRA